MNAFEKPRILSRVVDGTRNEVLLCVFPEGPGGRFLLLKTGDGDVQRSYLQDMGRRFPAAYSGTVLEVLMPFREGIPLSRFEREEQPDFSQRKRICLELLEGVVEDRVPPGLLVRIVSAGNIVLAQEGARLQYAPDYSGEAAPEEAYASFGRLCFELLNVSAGLSEENAGRYPPAYQLLWRRSMAGEYHTPEQLLKDLRALPDACGPRQAVRSALARRGGPLARKAAAVAVVLLGLLAVYCAAGALLRIRDSSGQEVNYQQTVISQIGDQTLTGD